MTKRAKGPGLRALLGAWGTWWAALGAVTLWRPLLAVLQATNGDGGSIAAGFDKGQLFLSASKAGRELLHTGASVGAVIGWIAVPPLVILAGWMALRASGGRGLASPGEVPALGEGDRAPVSFDARVREEVGRPITPVP